jgi:hypothetical protein
MRSKTMRQVGHVARVEDEGIWWRNLTERDYLGDPGVEGRIILK